MDSRTVLNLARLILTNLSLVMVALICSDPGVTVNEDLTQESYDHNKVMILLIISLCLEAMFKCLTGDTGRSTHVLV